MRLLERLTSLVEQEWSDNLTAVLSALKKHGLTLVRGANAFSFYLAPLESRRPFPNGIVFIFDEDGSVDIEIDNFYRGKLPKELSSYLINTGTFWPERLHFENIRKLISAIPYIEKLVVHQETSLVKDEKIFDKLKRELEPIIKKKGYTELRSQPLQDGRSFVFKVLDGGTEHLSMRISLGSEKPVTTLAVVNNYGGQYVNTRAIRRLPKLVPGIEEATYDSRWKDGRIVWKSIDALEKGLPLVVDKLLL